LRRQENAKAHRQADLGGEMLVKALHAAEAGVFAQQFKVGVLHELLSNKKLLAQAPRRLEAYFFSK
jgi:hypothetical protein